MRAWRERARQLKAEVHALARAARDPRVPWYARALAACIVAYAFSPLDLIPDPIPVLGYLDDLVLLPLGIALVVRLIPPEVLAEHRAQARNAEAGRGNWVAAGVIVLLWTAAFALVVLTITGHW